MLSLRLLSALVVLPLTLPAAIENWTNVDGVPMQAEFLGLKGDYVSFRKTDGGRAVFPYAKLTSADRARVDALTGKAAPKSPVTTQTTAPANQASQASASLLTARKEGPTRIATALYGKLVGIQDGVVEPLALDHLSGTRFYAIYYSASWCGPCQAFTPDLLAGYKEIKAAHPEFELILVSADRDEKAMKRYMLDHRMPWSALRYKEAQSNGTVEPYRQPGIPNLVFIDGEGKVLSKSVDDRGTYVGPRKVLNDIRRHFRM